ncbi:hypothetical protein [Candidatus Enterococcus murrayae]|uniref:Lipoprotein SmpA/OmlA domain-containing protein n=1 Tax=Candidatus Enterococcus murrayae TaxID=2815321 RepID=A0ABS3HP16_9ENTE|nr:hypothetical protein [Enterococcus sp. MJM16]MBO0454635.1 hypothetical protein [Enterococcus sp. MJM16]
MMDILKRNQTNKKNLFLYLIALLLFISSCSSNKELILSDFKENIVAGLSQEQVKKVLGEPQNSETEYEKVIQKWDYDSEHSSDRWPESYYDRFWGGKKKEQYFFDKTDQTTGWSYFEYDYRNKSYENPKAQIRQFRIYFVDNEVVWMSFP